MEVTRDIADSHVGKRRGAETVTAAAVEVTGRLVVTLDDDRTVELVGQGSRMRVDIGPLAPQMRSLCLLRSAAILARRLAPMLHRRTLMLVVTRNGEPLVDLGAGVDGGPVARLFGLSHVRVHRKRNE